MLPIELVSIMAAWESLQQCSSFKSGVTVALLISNSSHVCLGSAVKDDSVSKLVAVNGDRH